MHQIQEALLRLSKDQNILEMRLADLARLLNVDHLEQIKHHRNQLVKKGELQPAADSKKVTTETFGENSVLVKIPVLGSANAGPASLYVDGRVQGYLRVSKSLLPKSVPQKNLYALKVVGQSMNLAKIGSQKLSADNGDYVIADGGTYQPSSSDYVVTVLEGKANIKKLLINNKTQQLALVSESSQEFPPIIIDMNESTEMLVQSKILHVVKAPTA